MIVITSTGNKSSNLMDMRFAKCSYFCFLKDDGPEFIQNPFQEAEGHIAPSVVKWLKENEVEQVITGEIGSIAHKSLKEARIQTILIENDRSTIQAILKKFGK